MELETILTPRESQIAKMRLDGKTAQQIADQLKISRRTVEAHQANIARKMGTYHARD